MQGHVRKRHKADCALRGTGSETPVSPVSPALSNGEPADTHPRCTCDGSYQARYRLDGKFVEKTFRLKRDAQDWLTSEQAQLLQGTHVNPRLSERPFAEVVEAWRESWPGRIEPSTQLRYEQTLRLHVLPEFSSRPIGQIDRAAVQRWVNRMTADGKPSGTVRAAYTTLRAALNQAVRLGLIRSNPATRIDVPRQGTSEMLTLTPSEVVRLAEHIHPYYRVLTYTAAYTGLRAGELLALQRQDFDPLRKELRVNRALKDLNGKLSVGETKTHTRRTVSLPAFLNKMLSEHADALPPGPTQILFPSRSNGSYIRHSLFVRRIFRPAVAGYTDAKGTVHPGALPHKSSLRFHDLRHTAASLAIHAGANPLLVSKMLGHSSVTITLDRYSHLLGGEGETVAGRLDALYNAQPAATESNVVELRAAEEV